MNILIPMRTTYQNNTPVAIDGYTNRYYSDGSMTYRDISIGSNTRDASGLDATADLSLMNNTTA